MLRQVGLGARSVSHALLRCALTAHNLYASGPAYLQVDTFAGLITFAIILELVIWVWRPALQAEHREVSKAEFPVFSNVRTTETEAW